MRTHLRFPEDAPSHQVIGGNIRRLRLKAGHSQTDVAKVLSVTFQQVQKLEKGQNRLSALSMFRLAACWKTDMKEFFAEAQDFG